MKKTLLLASSLLMSGCGLLTHPALNITPAKINAPSELLVQMQQNPKPKFRIPVAVYSFRDQTGQYKPQQKTSTFSTAVTQGATPMLVQTLLDSEWFTPVEREGLQNLLTERKILQKNQIKIDKKNSDLPSLTNARLLLEGGIIGYETNTTTGGKGAGYFGITASDLYREDQVTVYLRAIDVHSGKVLLSVNTTKKIYSQQVRAGLNRFTSLNRLAEAEFGYSTNEPVQYCVKQAIELAVFELIEQGKKNKLWTAQPTIKG
ncbi:transporter [Parashewanella curva]|uniref:Curli production assembly/transport component CsgG n=1 Tax=Parashewanella curva TaxID=2338552 RepID=A0A3L8Q0K4_9GAMM|nr:CsgG/HfaB family protein [Parashewanella curva]RLV60559.1 transporter [Parashewanella curva]